MFIAEEFAILELGREHRVGRYNQVDARSQSNGTHTSMVCSTADGLKMKEMF